ncbi:MAG: cytosine-specific methyltransferase [Chloroflexus sp.]|nr:MAG: cytosine-specific methyltransferase [Chloroflexus sp.]
MRQRFATLSCPWPTMERTSLEIAAGAGGMAIGLERAGFRPVALVDIDPHAVQTLRANRPDWPVIQADASTFDASRYVGVDLLAGGIPCPPFSIAGKSLGPADERDLFPAIIRLAREVRPQAIVVENVRGLMRKRFAPYRAFITESIQQLGFVVFWRVLNAVDFGLPQHRPRAILVALRPEFAPYFRWPEPQGCEITVGGLLAAEMASAGWELAAEWSRKASGIAPAIVGGSKRHGGPDLGPTRARMAWRKVHVDARGLADVPPGRGFTGMPKLTVHMAALLQGFPADWRFCGGKTAAYRQVGNAFPPPVAEAVGRAVMSALRRDDIGAQGY